jgi:hypothetical protein
MAAGGGVLVIVDAVDRPSAPRLALAPGPGSLTVTGAF